MAATCVLKPSDLFPFYQGKENLYEEVEEKRVVISKDDLKAVLTDCWKMVNQHSTVVPKKYHSFVKLSEETSVEPEDDSSEEMEQVVTKTTGRISENLVDVKVTHNKYPVKLNLDNQGLDERDAQFSIWCLAFPAGDAKKLTGFEYESSEFRTFFSRFKGKPCLVEHYSPQIGTVEQVKFKKDGMHAKMVFTAPNVHYDPDLKELAAYTRMALKEGIMSEVSVAYRKLWRENEKNAGFEPFWLIPAEISVCYKGFLDTYVESLELSQKDNNSKMPWSMDSLKKLHQKWQAQEEKKSATPAVVEEKVQLSKEETDGLKNLFAAETTEKHSAADTSSELFDKSTNTSYTKEESFLTSKFLADCFDKDVDWVEKNFALSSRNFLSKFFVTGVAPIQKKNEQLSEDNVKLSKEIQDLKVEREKRDLKEKAVVGIASEYFSERSIDVKLSSTDDAIKALVDLNARRGEENKRLKKNIADLEQYSSLKFGDSSSSSPPSSGQKRVYSEMERFSAANNSNKRQRGSDDDGSDDSSVARLSKQQSDSVAKIFKASQCHQLHEKEVQMAESVMRTPIGGQNFADVLSSVLKSSKSGGLKPDGFYKGSTRQDGSYLASKTGDSMDEHGHLFRSS